MSCFIDVARGVQMCPFEVPIIGKCIENYQGMRKPLEAGLHDLAGPNATVFWYIFCASSK